MSDYTILEATPGIRALILPDNPRYTIVTVTDDFVTATGISRDNLKGRGLFEVFPGGPDDINLSGQASINASFMEVIQNKKPHLVPEQRYDIPGSNGTFTKKYWKTYNVPVLNDAGEVAYIIHTSEDITEQVLSEHRELRLKDIEKAYGLFMQAPVAVCIVSGADYIVELANEHMLQLLGRTSEIVGKPITESLTEAKIQGLVDILDHVYSTGESFHASKFPATLIIDGVRELRYFDLVFQPYFSNPADNIPAGISCVAYNITKQVLLQNQLEESEAELQRRVLERTNELERRNRELEQFTYVSHHDLQEPLRKIIMFADMVKSDSYDKLSEASQKRFDRIVHAARRMSTALRDMLNYASLDKQDEFEDVDLDEILASVQTDLELVISEKKARIISDALPVIKAVTHQMHQLFYNLVNNALKFVKAEVPPVITITCRELSSAEIRDHAELDEKKEYYMITVQDNGIGFHTGAVEKIFGMFQRLHSKDAYAGTGIGLALCKKVVNNHHGKLWAESIEGEGASFSILLPKM